MLAGVCGHQPGFLAHEFAAADLADNGDKVAVDFLGGDARADQHIALRGYTADGTIVAENQRAGACSHVAVNIASASDNAAAADDISPDLAFGTEIEFSRNIEILPERAAAADNEIAVNHNRVTEKGTAFRHILIAFVLYCHDILLLIIHFSAGDIKC